MDAIAILLPLALLWGVAVITPGPNFIAILSKAAAEGRPAALAAAAGTLVGTAIWAVAGLFGLQSLFVVLPAAAVTIKIIGAAYLLWVGISYWRRAGQPAKTDLGEGRGRPFWFGLITVLANPKTAAFAASLFAVAVPVGASWTLSLAALLTICAVSALWYFTLAAVGAIGPVGQAYRRARGLILRIAGGVFIGYGAKLAFDAR